MSHPHLNLIESWNCLSSHLEISPPSRHTQGVYKLQNKSVTIMENKKKLYAKDR